MSMYDACKYCSESTVKPGFVACSNPEHRELAKRAAQLAFDATPDYASHPRATKREAAVLLAREAGLPEDYLLNQIRPRTKKSFWQFWKK